MKLDYFLKGFVVSLFLMIALPAQANSRSETSAESVAAQAGFLQNRLNEIKALDKSALTHAEKKSLRKEVREIKKELAAVSGGVYLSVGAILLIALLLILLL